MPDRRIAMDAKSKKLSDIITKEKAPIIAVVLLCVLLITGVSIFGSSAFRTAVFNINKAHIDELAEHDINIIDSTVSARLDLLDSIAEDIRTWNEKDDTPINELLHSSSHFVETADRLSLVSADGTIFSSNNLLEARPDIAEVCCKRGERFVCRFDNSTAPLPDQRREYLLYGVHIKPLEYEGHTYEYICSFVKPKELEDELRLDSYDGRGFSSVIDSDGNYVLNINRSHSFLSRDNFFDDFESANDYSPETALNSDSVTNLNVVRAKINSDEYTEYNIAITPMKDVDWYLVSVVPSKVFDEQSKGLMRVAGLMMSVAALAILAVLYYMIRQRTQAAELAAKAETDELNRQLSQQQEALEEALSLAQSANRAKTTFLNNMSHDIRTPMNAIIGYTGLAASHIDSKEQVQDYLGKIEQSSEHLLSLINDVLDMSRIESGKMNLDEKDEDLAAILHTLRNIVQADISHKELDFFMDCDVSDEFVVCDKLRLNQVLLNILSNSIKYTQAGGTVSIRLRQNGVTETGYGKYEFRIKDNGMGMSEEFLKTIFEPFTRVKSSTVSGIQGTGLGMAITKNIIDMMGGTIDIKSKEGEGTETTIIFEFKLANGSREPVKIVELEGLKSLVVDDDTSACMNIAKMLRTIGMRSEWCASGKEAVIRTEESMQIGEQFKVYIIDWMMPDMNGVETTRRIRQIVGDEAPIIVLTAYDWSDIEDEARAAGVTAFVSKPLFPSDLHKVLSKCCNAAAADQPVAEEKIDFTGRKILLVEDNMMNREIATEILEEYGFVVDTAEDGTIAVNKMKAAQPGQYDLILMDVQMPVMDGYEATRQIRALPDPALANITIIAMTANAFEEDRQEALKAGMNEHLAKPISIEKLTGMLARFIKQ